MRDFDLRKLALRMTLVLEPQLFRLKLCISLINALNERSPKDINAINPNSYQSNLWVDLEMSSSQKHKLGATSMPSTFASRVIQLPNNGTSNYIEQRWRSMFPTPAQIPHQQPSLEGANDHHPTPSRFTQHKTRWFCQGETRSASSVQRHVSFKQLTLLAVWYLVGTIISLMYDVNVMTRRWIEIVYARISCIRTLLGILAAFGYIYVNLCLKWYLLDKT